MQEFQGWIRFPDTVAIPSTNQMYLPTSNGRGKSWLRKNPEVADYQRQVHCLVAMTPLVQIKKISSLVEALHLDLTFYLKTHFTNRDLDNLLKSTLDAMVKIIGVDDSKIMDLKCRKLKSKESFESILIKIQVLNHYEVQRLETAEAL